MADRTLVEVHAGPFDWTDRQTGTTTRYGAGERLSLPADRVISYRNWVHPVEGEPDPEPPMPEATASAVALAEASGLDLSAIEGTGKGGKVVKADVEKALEG